MKATDDTLLRRSSLFQFLAGRTFRKAPRRSSQEEHYEFGDIIVRQGEPADAFYILLSGRARVVKADQSGDEMVLASAEAGRQFRRSRARRRRHPQRDRALQHGRRSACGSIARISSQLVEQNPGAETASRDDRAASLAARISLPVQQFRPAAGARACAA